MVKKAYLSEEEEIKLVEKVDLKLLLARNDSSFEKVLDTFLAPLLLKLASNHASVRALVFNSIKHLSSRLSSNINLKIPIQKLLLQCKNPSINEDQDWTDVLIYTLYFLAKGVDRCTQEEKENIIPSLIEKISALPPVASCRIFHVLCKTLLSRRKVGLMMESYQKTTLDLKKEDIEFLMDKFIKFFLFIPQSSASTSRTHASPGLSTDEVLFFQYNPALRLDRTMLNAFRKAIFEFVTTTLAENTRLWVPFLIVVSIQSVDLSEKATTYLKRTSIPYNDPKFLNYLLPLFLGSSEQNISPVRVELQEKFLSIFKRSLEITTNKEVVYQIIMTGLSASNLKLKTSTLEFIQHVSEHKYSSLIWSGSQDIKEHICFSIKNDIKSTEWSSMFQDSTNTRLAIRFRMAQYETICELVRKDIALVEDFTLVEFLLESLANDRIEFTATIQDSLSLLAVHFPNISHIPKNKLKKLAEYDLDRNDRYFHDSDEQKRAMSSRFILLKFINSALPFDDVFARYYNILGTSSLNRFDVVQESFRGLNPYEFRMNQASLKTDLVKTNESFNLSSDELPFPDFEELSEYILARFSDIEDISGIVDCISNAFLFIQQTLISNSVYGEKTIILQDENWSLRMENFSCMDPRVRELICEKIKGCNENTVIELCRFLIQKILIPNAAIANKSSLFDLFLLLVQCSSDSILTRMEFAARMIFDLAKSGVSIPQDKMLILSNIFGTIATGLSNDSATIKELSSIIGDETSSLNIFSFAIGGFALPRLVVKGNSNVMHLLKRLYWLSFDFLSLNEYKTVAQTVSCEMMKFKILCYLSIAQKEKIMETWIPLLRKNLLNNEKAVLLWALLSLNQDKMQTLDFFLSELEEVHVSKNVDYLFATGESLTILLSGWDSSFLRQQLDFNVHTPSFLDENRGFLEPGLRRILTLCLSTRPSIQKASCVWMLCIVQYLGHSPILAKLLPQVHQKFVRFLGNRDEFVRETATRGICLTYELGDPQLKEEMVKELLHSFTNTSKTISLQASSVSEGTELFEPGLLNTGEGFISTYKDLLNLANEVNDPGLVYKFMSLSKNSTLWSSRKGLAFGLGTILTKYSLEDQLSKDNTMFEKLIPALYRYRFDSSEAVSQSMENLWKTLIPNSATVIAIYFDNILADLTKNIGSQEWRVREASCSGMASLLQSYPPNKFYSVAEDLWSVAFRSMDDINGNVRTAGTKFASTLSTSFFRYFSNKELEQGEAKRLLEILLSFLLGPKGLTSDVVEVRSFSIKTLMELIEKCASTYIEDYIPRLIYELTLLLSAFEPQALNYLSLNADKYNVPSSLLDKNRSQAVFNSPIMVCITNLIISINSEQGSLGDLVDYIVQAVKKSVGFPSKIASSKVLQLVSQHHGDGLKPYSNRLLKVCFSAMEDRNNMVSLSFAESFGYLFKISKIAKAIKYSRKLVEKFFETDVANGYLVVATAVNSMFEHSAEQFKNMSTILMPLIFIAKENLKHESHAIFDRVWIDASKVGAGTLLLYFSEIIQLAVEHINSNKFTIRKMCAVSIQAASMQYTGAYSENDMEVILENLLKACEGRPWDGKEYVVEGLIKTSIKFIDYISNSPHFHRLIREVLMTEVSKQNSGYVKKLLGSFSVFVLSNPDKELVEKLVEILSNIFAQNEGKDFAGLLRSSEDCTDNTFDLKNKKPRYYLNLYQSSTKENIIEEEYRISILKIISINYTLKCELNHENSLSFLGFILMLTKNLFAFSHSWRSQVAYFEIALNLLERASSPRSSILRESSVFESCWYFGMTFGLQKETIENVKVNMIRLGSILRVKIPSIKAMIDHDVLELLEIDESSILKSEASEFLST